MKQTLLSIFEMHKIMLIFRFDAQTGADREVQRILLELLNQMDGFDQTTNVKVDITANISHKQDRIFIILIQFYLIIF